MNNFLCYDNLLDGTKKGIQNLKNKWSETRKMDDKKMTKKVSIITGVCDRNYGTLDYVMYFINFM